MAKASSKRKEVDHRNVNSVACEVDSNGKAVQTDYRVKGCGGLYLRCYPSGKRSYILFYKPRGAVTASGKRQTRRVVLGSPSKDYTVSAAKKEADRLKDEVHEGGDPLATRAQAAAEAVTFAQAVEDYHKRYLVGEAGNDSADLVKRALLRECKPWLKRRFDSITAKEIGALLEGIRDGGRRYSANRLYAYLRHMFAWATRSSVGFIKESPCADIPRPWKDEKPRKVFFEAEELGALYRAAGRIGVYEGVYLRVLLLTAKRKRALADMEWSEIASDGWWRMADDKQRLPEDKAKKLNMPIPLPAPALKILRGLPKIKGNSYVFAGRHHGKPLSPGRPLQDKIKAVSGVDKFIFHAARDTAITHLGWLRVPGNAARRFTDHAQVNDAHERSYSSHDLATVTEDCADTWGRFVLLVAHKLIWTKVDAHLKALDIEDEDERKRAKREREREFCGLIQAGGQSWTRYVRSITRPAEGKIVRLAG